MGVLGATNPGIRVLAALGDRPHNVYGKGIPLFASTDVSNGIAAVVST